MKKKKMTVDFSLSVKWPAALGKCVSVRVRGSLFKSVVKLGRTSLAPSLGSLFSVRLLVLGNAPRHHHSQPEASWGVEETWLDYSPLTFTRLGSSPQSPNLRGQRFPFRPGLLFTAPYFLSGSGPVFWLPLEKKMELECREAASQSATMLPTSARP